MASPDLAWAPCQGPAAEARVQLEGLRGHSLDEDRTFHVAQLPPVQVAIGPVPLRPAEENVARSLHHPLALHYAFAGVLELALGEGVLEHRCGWFFDLQEQWVAIVATLEQDDECAGSPAADADHMPGHVDQLDALQQVPAVNLQRGPIRLELTVDDVHELVGGYSVHALELTRPNHDRGLADGPIATVDNFAKLRECLQAVACVCLSSVLRGQPLCLRNLLGILLLGHSWRGSAKFRRIASYSRS